MPDAKKPAGKQFGKDRAFRDAVKHVAADNRLQENYLGNPETVFRLLQFYSHNALEVIEKSFSEKVQRRAIQEPSREISAILLGMREKEGWVSQPGWNQPGGVDVFLAKWCGSSEKEPRRRCEQAMLSMFEDILDVAIVAGIPGVLDEQVEWEIAGILERYTYLCLGLTPAMQEMASEGEMEI